MNWLHRLAIIVTLALTVSHGAVGAEQTLETNRDKISYAIGVDLVRNFRKQEVEFDPEIMMKGVHDALGGSKLLIPDKEMRRAMNGLQAEVRQKMALTRRLAADENKRRGAAYLEENKGNEGVVVLANGLQYRVLKAGLPDGRKPVDSDLVDCHYRGTLLDGTEFDSTDPSKPATLKVSALIAGWKEALKLMPVGAKWRLAIPSPLAYGERGVGSDIGPNETLLFEVELVAIK
jgi:FKBP-type peptidyl-prolyl cis-trans isomerase FklB